MPACRILITTKEHTDLPAYNPEDHNGPWWYDKESQKHYYNNNYCLEFMFEENISLHNLRSIDFCDHHPKFCSINKSTPSICAELGISANIASAYFIIQAMGNGVDIFNYPGIKCDTPKDPFATSQIRNAATSFIYIKRNNEPFSGPVCKDCDGAKELMKTIMSLYSPQNLRRTRILASLFCSRDDFLDVAQSIFCECLGYNPFDFDNPLLSSKKISM